STRPAANASAVRARGVARRGDSAMNAPNGRYATKFAITSKRVQRNGHGANGQNGVSGSGRIHGENGCRLANTMATPERSATACGSSGGWGGSNITRGVGQKGG